VDAATGARDRCDRNASPFIAYPYEWCFSQFKRCSKKRLLLFSGALWAHGYVPSRDASAYNIAFPRWKKSDPAGHSFRSICTPRGRPWVAYRQFLRTISSRPLALMANRDIRLAKTPHALTWNGIPLGTGESPAFPGGRAFDLKPGNAHPSPPPGAASVDRRRVVLRERKPGGGVFSGRSAGTSGQSGIGHRPPAAGSRPGTTWGRLLR